MMIVEAPLLLRLSLRLSGRGAAAAAAGWLPDSASHGGRHRLPSPRPAGSGRDRPGCGLGGAGAQTRPQTSTPQTTEFSDSVADKYLAAGTASQGPGIPPVGQASLPPGKAQADRFKLAAGRPGRGSEAQ